MARLEKHPDQPLPKGFTEEALDNPSLAQSLPTPASAGDLIYADKAVPGQKVPTAELSFPHGWPKQKDQAWVGLVLDPQMRAKGPRAKPIKK